MYERLLVGPITAFVIAGSTGCATKKFVRTHVSDVNEKIDALARSLEETQATARQNAHRISEVDGEAQAAQHSAAQAERAAQQATQTASNAATGAQKAISTSEAMDWASRRLVGELVLSQAGYFSFNQTDLADAAKVKLDELVVQLTKDPKNVFFEIEGYTDSVGPKSVNDRVGRQRAEAVMRYLHEHHQISLHRINVISYGEERPASPNSSSAGRAQNRRVVVRVLA
jgi:outer membrane protein OmpA-like peptidoglycan-associated protein